jgi:hypothetical protein
MSEINYLLEEMRNQVESNNDCEFRELGSSKEDYVMSDGGNGQLENMPANLDELKEILSKFKQQQEFI